MHKMLLIVLGTRYCYNYCNQSLRRMDEPATSSGDRRSTAMQMQEAMQLLDRCGRISFPAPQAVPGAPRIELAEPAIDARGA